MNEETLLLIWLSMLISFILLYVFKFHKYFKNNDEKVLYLIFALTIVFSPPFVWFIVSTKSIIGFIYPQHIDAWIGFYGAIIGGALTLFGVWWTITDQNKKRKEDQELRDKERKEELAIQYKPFLRINLENIFTYSIKKFDDIKSKDNTEFNGFYVLQLSKKINSVKILRFKISNCGDGECFIQCNDSIIKTYNILMCFEPDLQNITQYQHAKYIRIGKNWHNMITRHGEIYINLYILYDKNHKFDKGTIDLIFKMKYTDQLELFKYDATTHIGINVECKDNNLIITSPSYVILNEPKTEKKDQGE